MFLNNVYCECKVFAPHTKDGPCRFCYKYYDNSCRQEKEETSPNN